MKQFYIYIFCDSNRENFNVGYSFDIKRTVLLYAGLPMYMNAPDYRKNILVGVWTVLGEDQAKAKLKKVQDLTSEKKIELIKKMNPDFIELTPGKNFEI